MSKEQYVEDIWSRIIEDCVEYFSGEANKRSITLKFSQDGKLQPIDEYRDYFEERIKRQRVSDNRDWGCKVVCTMCGEPIEHLQDGMLAWWVWGSQIVHAGVIHNGAVNNCWCMRQAEHIEKCLAGLLKGFERPERFKGCPDTALLMTMHLANCKHREKLDIYDDYDGFAWVGSSRSFMAAAFEATLRNFEQDFDQTQKPGRVASSAMSRGVVDGAEGWLAWREPGSIARGNSKWRTPVRCKVIEVGYAQAVADGVDLPRKVIVATETSSKTNRKSKEQWTVFRRIGVKNPFVWTHSEEDQVDFGHVKVVFDCRFDGDSEASLDKIQELCDWADNSTFFKVPDGAGPPKKRRSND